MGRFFWLKLLIRQEKPSRVFFPVWVFRLHLHLRRGACTLQGHKDWVGDLGDLEVWIDGWMDTPPEVPTVQKETTVDGRNPAPVDRLFIPLFIGFHTSQVVQDFSHQQ